MDAAGLRALDPNCSVVVRACAGSGKTWLLTSRIIRILLERPELPLSAILAITFTENAAAEIKERIKERLAQMAAASDDDLTELLAQIGIEANDATKTQARRLHRRILLAQPPLTIHTFHGWFKHIIDYLPWAQRPVLTDRVLQNPKLLLRQAWQQSLREILRDAKLTQHLQTLLGKQKLGTLRSVLTNNLNERRLDWLMKFGERIERTESIEIFNESLSQLLPPPPGEGISTSKLIYAKDFHQAVGELVSLDHAPSMKKRLEPLDGYLHFGHPPQIEVIKKALLTAKGTPPDLIAKRCIKHAPELIEQVFDRLVAAIAWDNWETTVRLNRSYVALGHVIMRNFQQLKLAQGVMDFGDMELSPAEAMLAGRPSDKQAVPANAVVGEMLERMDARFDHILVDEFQDTNPTQWWMLRTWLDASAQGDSPPSVFLVGDPKQSVYSFRHADPRLLETASRYLSEPPYSGELIEFNTTRRCSQPVIDMVNATFARSSDLESFDAHETTQPDLFGEIYCLPPPEKEEKEEKEPNKNVDEGDNHLRNALTEAAKETQNDDAAVKEAAQLAKLLEQIVGKKVIKPVNGPPRLCTLDDILLLYPVRTGVANMLRELASRGFSCAAPEAESRSETLEYQDIIALLHAIYDPNYGLMLAHTLSSPIFGVDSDDLQAIYDAGGKDNDWVGGLMRAKGSKELVRAQDLLDNWRGLYLRQKLPTHELLAHCYSEGDILRRYMAAVEPRLRKRVALNLEWLLNFAHEAEGGSLAQLSAFAHHLAELADAEGTESTNSNIAGAIRVMTIHKAKGLESPVVILTNADFNVPNDSSRLLSDWDLAHIEQGPAHFSYCFTPTATPEQEKVMELAKLARQKEQANKLYVAMTRACNILIVSARERKKKVSVNWRTQIAEVLADFKHEHEAGFMVYRGGKPLRSGDQSEDEEAGAEMRQLVPLARQPKQIGHNEVHATIQSRHGTLVHNIIALTLTKADPAKIRIFLAVDHAEFAQLQQICNKMIGPQSAMGKLLAQASFFECEMPLIDADGRSLRIDCYLETDTEAWVIDFKTGATDREAYVQQLRGYMGVLEEEGRAGNRRMRAALVDSEGSLQELTDKVRALASQMRKDSGEKVAN